LNNSPLIDALRRIAHLENQNTEFVGHIQLLKDHVKDLEYHVKDLETMSEKVHQVKFLDLDLRIEVLEAAAASTSVSSGASGFEVLKNPSLLRAGPPDECF